MSGSGEQIAAALGVLELDWDAVGHVMLTHSHGDHTGSVEDVLTRAAAATGYAGAADIPHISSPRELVPVADGDVVFGLQIVATPGAPRDASASSTHRSACSSPVTPWAARRVTSW